MDVGHIVISSYSDVSRNPRIVKIHFRKFLSKSLFKKTVRCYPKIRKISLSDYAFKRLDKSLCGLIKNNGIEIEFSKRCLGRPNLLYRWKSD